MDKKYFLILGIGLFLILSSISFVCAIDGYVWNTYGADFSPLQQSQYKSSDSRFDSVVLNLSMDIGLNQTGLSRRFQYMAYQPLVTHLNISIDPVQYLIFQNGDYLQVYDNSLNLMQEISSGYLVSQIDTFDWDGDGSDDIAGIYATNSSYLTLKIFKYNTTFNSLVLGDSYNFISFPANLSAGIRHTGNKAIFTIPLSSSGTNFTQAFIIVNLTGVQTYTVLDNQSCFYTEPIAFYEMDGDGNIEYLTFCGKKGGTGTTSQKGSVVVFMANGTIKFSYTSSGGVYDKKILLDAKMVYIDATGFYKIAILEGEQSVHSPFSYERQYSTISLKRLDGSTLWTNTYSGTEGGAYGRLAIDNDYNGDLYQDIFMMVVGSANLFETVTLHPKRTTLHIRILNGDSGTTILNKNFGYLGNLSDNREGVASLTIADVNGDHKLDFLGSFTDGIFLYDLTNQRWLQWVNTTDDNSYLISACIPADLNFDGFQEVICSGTDKTIEFYSNETNQNAQIDSLTFNPSATVINGTTITVTIGASDNEGNSPIYYQYKCNDSMGWSVADAYADKVCTYNTVGDYTFWASVRDPYHFVYTTFSQVVHVTSTGGYCGDGICGAGENSTNCFVDCLPANYTQAQGGIPLPLKLVDTENIDSGLLPEIYYGTLAFLSNTLSPMIILIFIIFFVLIVMAIGTIIKKIANNVGR